METKLTFAHAASTDLESSAIVESLARKVHHQMAGRSIDALIVFLSPHHTPQAASIGAGLRESLQTNFFHGHTASLVIFRPAYGGETTPGD